MAEPTYDEALILSYVEGDLSDADRVRFEQQCQADPALQALADDLAKDRAALRALPHVALPRNFAQDVIYQQERSQLLGQPDALPALESDALVAKRTFRVTRVLVSSALAALVLICSGVLLITLTDPGLLDVTQQFHGPSPRFAHRDSSKLEKDVVASAQVHPKSAKQTRSNLDQALNQARAELTEHMPPQATSNVSSSVSLVAKGQGMDEPQSIVSKGKAIVLSEASAPKPVSSKSLALQVTVDTDNPQATRRDLYAWANHNQAQVVRDQRSKSQRLTGLILGFKDEDPALDSASAPGAEAVDERLVLWVQANQLPALMTHLNQRAGQRAQLEGAMPSSAPKQAFDALKQNKRFVATDAMRSRTAFSKANQESAPAFSWGQVLESQLPLIEPMPFSQLPRRVPVTLILHRHQAPATQPAN